jgi:hypothetical protein
MVARVDMVVDGHNELEKLSAQCQATAAHKDVRSCTEMAPIDLARGALVNAAGV